MRLPGKGDSTPPHDTEPTRETTPVMERTWTSWLSIKKSLSTLQKAGVRTLGDATPRRILHAAHASPPPRPPRTLGYLLPIPMFVEVLQPTFG